MIQGSPEWFAARAGKFSASRIKDLLGTKAARRRYLLQLLSQRLNVEGSMDATPMTAAMQWGVDHESAAKSHYWAITGLDVEEHPGQAHPTFGTLWASPDGLVGTDGMVEIKCPNPTTHLQTILDGHCPPEHHHQIHTGMFVFSRAWCDFITFDPRNPACPIYISRVERDNEWIDEALLPAINEGERELQDMLHKIMVAREEMS